jgi:hypothetical protein
MNPRHATLGCLLLLLVAAPARAETDWFASLYTQEGVELRADERIFAAFALFNALGYVEGPIVRQYPITAREHDPVRVELRKKLQLTPELESKANAFFDKHPVPAQAYGRYILTTKGPPSFERTPESPEDLNGFEQIVAEFYQLNGLGPVFAALQEDYRKALKVYHGAVDGPLAAVRKVLKVKEDEPPRLILIVNPLDGRGSAYSSLQGDELFVVLGPAAQPDVFAILTEYARARLAPALAKKGALKSLTDQAAAAGIDPPPAFALEAISRAVACVALGLPEAEIAARATAGFWAIPELTAQVRAYDRGDKAFDVFVNDSLVALAIIKEPPKDASGAARKSSKAK